MTCECVTPQYIKLQRTLDWLDIHPEDFCHKCGAINPLWYTTREQWIFATQSWAELTGREGICCPTCFFEMFNESVEGSGKKWIMKITIEELK